MIWKVFGEFKVKRIPNVFFLFVFPSKVEVDRVLKDEKQEWGEILLLLDVWHPRAGCRNGMISDPRTWIRVFRVLTHLWCIPTMKVVGDLCGVFLQADFEDKQSMEWV